MSPPEYLARIFAAAARPLHVRLGAGLHRFRRLGLGLILGLVAGGVAHADVKAGDHFPSLANVAFEGGVPPITGGRVVLVDFWASWCAPCKASFPAYAKLQADYAGRGLVIVAVSVDENAGRFAAFVKKFDPSFITLRDKSQELVRQVRVPAMPTCYLLGRDGRVRYLHEGFHGADTERELREEIDALLAEPNSPP